MTPPIMPRIAHDSAVVLLGDSLGWTSIEALEKFCSDARHYGVNPAVATVKLGNPKLRASIAVTPTADLERCETAADSGGCDK